MLTAWPNKSAGEGHSGSLLCECVEFQIYLIKANTQQPLLSALPSPCRNENPRTITPVNFGQHSQSHSQVRTVYIL